MSSSRLGVDKNTFLQRPFNKGERVSSTLKDAFLESEQSAAIPWKQQQLDEKMNLCQLRSKFWGKSIEEDAEEWRESNPTVEVDPTNDIGVQCYGLDLGIKIKNNKLWVREDYIRMYDYCVKLHAEGPTSKGDTARSVIITGQPGVGKTFWTTYAIRRRLGEGLPFLWHTGTDSYLFVEDGVYREDPEKVAGCVFAPFLWAFVDADHGSDLTGAPIKLASKTNLFIVFTSSPKRSRWWNVTRHTAWVRVVMNAWFLEEMRQATKFLGFTKEEQDLAEDHFENLGPLPRLFIGFVRNPEQLTGYELDRRDKIAGLTSDSLRHFVQKGGDLDLDAESQKLFLVRRDDLDELKIASIGPITANVRMEITTVLDKMRRLDQIDLYHHLASYNASRKVAGLVYESVCHTLLQEGAELRLWPMFKYLMQRNFHWETQVNAMDQDELAVNFPQNSAFTYGDDQTSVERGRLHVPKASNKFTNDSFFLLGETLYILQFTMASRHDIKKTMEVSFSNLLNSFPPKTNWRFVFVVPPGHNVNASATPTMEESLRGVALYLAHLDPNERTAALALP